MNRNTNSHFAMNPQANIERSKFARHNDYKTTADSGNLFVFHVDEVLPGDTFEVSTSSLFRMATPLHPVMDNCYMDYYYFFVPNRLLWEHWEQFMGSHESAWDSDIIYQIPQLSVPEGGFSAGSLADYFGIPTYTGEGDSVNVLPFRAYRKIWNDWFRDQNLMDEVKLNLGDDGDVNGDEDYNLYDLLPVCKLHDYFTTGLPQPQRGEDVTLPLLGDAPVMTGIMHSPSEMPVSKSMFELGWYGVGSNPDTMAGMHNVPLYIAPTERVTGLFNANGVKFGSTVAEQDDHASLSNQMILSPGNLWANLDNASMATVSELRNAFAVQRFLEKEARGGSRYTEILRSFFGVVSPDSRLQRSEYLGGKRVPINVQDVVQSAPSSFNDDQVLGTNGAYSKTVDASGSFTRSFVEHGYVIGVACIRTDRSYQQGLNRMWSRKDRFDFYWPTFVGVGDQPVYEREIYWQNANAAGVHNGSVFAYQERYGEYRYYPSQVTGAFRTNFPGGGLDSWHYSDYYESPPVLSEDWIIENPGNIDRTVKLDSDGFAGQQFIIDFYIQKFCTRPMPVYSVPGMIDHF